MLTLVPQAPAPRPVAHRAQIRALPIRLARSSSPLTTVLLCPHPRHHHHHPLLARAASAGGGGAGGGAGDTGAAGEEAQGKESRASEPDPLASAPTPRPNHHREDAADDADADRGIEAVVEAVKPLGGHGVSVILLRLLDGTSRLLPIYVGEFEARSLAAAQLGAPPSPSSSSSSSSAAAASSSSRPQTYDLLKSTISALGREVSHVSVVDLRHNTYYAIVTLVPSDGGEQQQQDKVEIDARPSDALNLAARCGCPLYVARDVAERCALPEQLLPPELQTEPPPPPPSASAFARQARAPSPAGAVVSALLPHHHHQQNHYHQGQRQQQQQQQESHADIVRTARAALLAYRDPTPMLALARDVAAAQERFEAAAHAQALLAECVTRDGALRLAAAVEAALADGRYAEAARLRDELLRAVEEQEARVREMGAGGGLDNVGGALP